MDTSFLNKKNIATALSVIFCTAFFIAAHQLDEQSNAEYNERVKKESYRVKVCKIKRERYYEVVGDSLGHLKDLTISPFWNLHAVQPGDSLIKKPNSFEIRIVSKGKPVTVTPSQLPL